MRLSLLRRAKKLASDSLSKSPLKDDVAVSNNNSLYEKYKPFATPAHVEGIWRAPRAQTFTKEQFDNAYPESYKGMRIGLARPGTFAAKYANPKFDEVSPLLWTVIVFTPLTYWLLYELKHIYFPSDEEGH